MLNQSEQASAMTYQAERTLREATLDYGMDFTASYRVQITSLIQQLHQALSGDSEELVAITGALRTVVYELQRAIFDRNQVEGESWDTWRYWEGSDNWD
jgi:molecular chaperone DnaK